MVRGYPKILLVYSYFGETPWYFQYFLMSCKYNHNLNFVIFHDWRRLPDSLPPNVQLIKTKFRDFLGIGKSVLGNKMFNAKVPYKLCDFRPAYGYIFTGLLKHYDFWGYGDLDVIFGDTQKFIDTKMLSEHDVIFPRYDFVTGWFSLYRNNAFVNTLFQQSKDYTEVFSSPEYLNFDETSFLFSEFSMLLPFYMIHGRVESMTHIVKRLEHERRFNPFFDMMAVEGIPGNINFDNGVLTYKNEFEVFCYHLKEFKTLYSEDALNKEITDSFSITTNNIMFMK